jgi:hypothetical protein
MAAQNKEAAKHLSVMIKSFAEAISEIMDEELNYPGLTPGWALQIFLQGEGEANIPILCTGSDRSNELVHAMWKHILKKNWDKHISEIHESGEVH